MKRAELLFALLCFGAFATLTVLSLDRVGGTTDERLLILGGRAIVNKGDWSTPLTRFHGPLPLYANQCLSPPLEGDGAETLFWSRLGMLPFGLLTVAIVFVWARSAFSHTAALVATAITSLHPLMIGYAGLVAVDMAHTALVMTALFLLWRYSLEPSLSRLLPLGIALGASFAGKYLALLWSPLVALFVLGFSLRRSPSWRGLLNGLAHVLLLAALSLFALHASYRFLTGFAGADPADYRSALVRSCVTTPVLGSFLTLLPRAFLLGVDFQLSVSGGGHPVYLRGEFDAGHADYYLWCIVLKSPEPVLALVFAGLFAALAVSVRGGWPAEVRNTALILLPSIAVPLAYLSLFTTLQIGVRYILPLFPMLFLLAACGVHAWTARAKRASPTRGAWVALVALSLLLAVDVGTQWPNLIAYFNRTSGGQARGYLHFGDSNCDWGQLRSAGREEILERHPGAEILGPGDGPRFGKVAVYLSDLVRPSGELPCKPRSWLFAFRPIDHAGAAWWVFDITRERFEAAIGAKAASREALVVALLGADELEAASAHLDQSQDPNPKLFRLRDLLRRRGREDIGAAGYQQLSALWVEVGRPDRVHALVADPRARGSIAPYFVALASVQRGRYREGIEILEGIENVEQNAASVLLLIEAYKHGIEHERDYDRIVELLERALPHMSAQERAPAVQVLDWARTHGEWARQLHRSLR